MYEAKTRLSQLLDEAASGEEVVIARNGRPVAKLVPLQEEDKGPRRLGTLEGRVWIADDFDDTPAEETDSWYYGDPHRVSEQDVVDGLAVRPGDRPPPEDRPSGWGRR